MRKGIVLLIVTLIYNCGIYADTITSSPIMSGGKALVQVSQERLKALEADSAKNVIIAIARAEAEKVCDGRVKRIKELNDKINKIDDDVIKLKGNNNSNSGLILPKTILLMFFLAWGCCLYAQTNEQNSSTVTVNSTVNISQERFDSLISDSVKYQKELMFHQEGMQTIHDYWNITILLVAFWGIVCVSAIIIINRRLTNRNKAVINSLNIEKNQYNIMGVSYYHVGDYEKAISSYNKAIELDSEYAKAYNNRGSAYLQKGDYDAAISDFDKAIKLNPKFTDAYNNRGYAYDDKGDYDQAIKDYDKAIELNPQYAATYYNRAIAYSNKGDNDQAIKDYDKVIELNPQDADAYINRGLAYSNKGDNDQAIKDYDKAIELNPQYVEAYNNRGLAYSNKGDNDQAIKDYDKAIGLNPKDARAYNGLCYVYLGKKDFPAALDAVNKAIALAPSDPDYLDSRADVLIAWGKYKKEHPEEYPEIDWKENIRNALSDVEKAFSLNPYEELKNVLEDKRAECKRLLEE